MKTRREKHKKLVRKNLTEKTSQNHENPQEEPHN
jgi:hypothetical protein